MNRFKEQLHLNIKIPTFQKIDHAYINKSIIQTDLKILLLDEHLASFANFFFFFCRLGNRKQCNEAIKRIVQLRLKSQSTYQQKELCKVQSFQGGTILQKCNLSVFIAIVNPHCGFEYKFRVTFKNRGIVFINVT